MKKDITSILGLTLLNFLLLFSFAACGNDGPQGPHDKRLIGTWVHEQSSFGEVVMTEEITFTSSGDYEWISSISRESSIVKYEWTKGTWESDGKQITFSQITSSDGENNGQVKNLPYTAGSNQISLGGLSFNRKK